MFDQPDVDPREFGIDPDEENCPECGAGPFEDCAWHCTCRSCLTGKVETRPRVGDTEAA